MWVRSIRSRLPAGTVLPRGPPRGCRVTAPQFLDRARELDADIQALDRRHLFALANDAPLKSLQRLAAQRNALVQQWAKAWGVQPIGEQP